MSEHKPSKFSGGRLLLARHVRGLELSELAQEVGIERIVLLRYESGAQYPSQAHIKQLAEYLGFPIMFFLREGRVYAKPPLGRTIQWFAGS